MGAILPPGGMKAEYLLRYTFTNEHYRSASVEVSQNTHIFVETETYVDVYIFSSWRYKSAIYLRTFISIHTFTDLSTYFQISIHICKYLFRLVESFYTFTTLHTETVYTFVDCGMYFKFKHTSRDSVTHLQSDLYPQIGLQQ